jgi:threonine dehydrogenase-like Zn-dependent dehydrogenase
MSAHCSATCVRCSSVEKGEIDPSFVITHRLKLEDGPGAYKTFRDKKDGCIKVVLAP